MKNEILQACRSVLKKSSAVSAVKLFNTGLEKPTAFFCQNLIRVGGLYIVQQS